MIEAPTAAQIIWRRGSTGGIKSWAVIALVQNPSGSFVASEARPIGIFVHREQAFHFAIENFKTVAVHNENGEIALQDVSKPIGVAEYQLLIPAKELEAILRNEFNGEEPESEAEDAT